MFTYSASKEFEWPFMKYGEASEAKLGIDVSALITTQGSALGGWPAENQVLRVKLHSLAVISVTWEMFSLIFPSAMKNTSYLFFSLSRITTGFFIE